MIICCSLSGSESSRKVFFPHYLHMEYAEEVGEFGLAVSEMADVEEVEQ